MKKILADIITIGDEILYGQITDTNSQWISAELDKIGIHTKRKSSVSDKKNDILEIVQEASTRSDLIIITGGLGATNDDITKKTLAEYFQCPLELHEEALKAVTHFFERRNRPLTETNRSQAYLPSTCQYLPNNAGLAPGMWFEKNGKIFVSLPGVPFEMKDIMSSEVLPRIKNHFETPIIYHQLIKTIGIGESNLSDLISSWENQLPKHIGLAYLPSLGEVKLRLTATGETLPELQRDIQKELEKLRPLIEEYIFSYKDEPLEKVIGDVLRAKKLTLATAESCTGGFISHLLTSMPGSSDFFKGSIVAYHNEIKTTFLDVKEEDLIQHGAVSEQTVLTMAEMVRKKFNTDIGIAVSGIAGPGGGTEEKPVGTVWIAYSDTKKTVAKKLILTTRRDNNIRLSSYFTLNLIRQESANL